MEEEKVSVFLAHLEARDETNQSSYSNTQFTVMFSRDRFHLIKIAVHRRGRRRERRDLGMQATDKTSRHNLLLLRGGNKNPQLKSLCCPYKEHVMAQFKAFSSGGG